MVSNTALNFDQLGDTTGRPQPVIEAQSLRSALQPSFNSAQIRRREPRRSPDLLRSAQRATSAFF
jgi:hypothetical protein